MTCTRCQQPSEPREHLFYRWGEERPEVAFRGNYCNACRRFLPDEPREEALASNSLPVSGLWRLNVNQDVKT